MSGLSIEPTISSRTMDAPGAGTSGRPRRSWASRDRPVVGLDIGSKSTKVIELQRSETKISLQQAAVFPTPPEAMTAGEFTNGMAVAEQLDSIWQAYDFKTPRVAASVRGEKVFCQCRDLSSKSPEYIESAVRRDAESVVPYSLETATLDYEIFSTPGGDRLLWVSVPTEQVVWLQETVGFAGKTAELVDVEACALANVFVLNSLPQDNVGSLVLHAGSRTLNACLMRGDTLLCSRTVRLDQGGSQSKDQPRAIAAESHRLWDQLSELTQTEGVESIWVSGGGARDEVIEAISEGFEVQARPLDPFREIDVPADSDLEGVVKEHRATLAIAVGLALRSFQDL